MADTAVAPAAPAEKSMSPEKKLLAVSTHINIGMKIIHKFAVT